MVTIALYLRKRIGQALARRCLIMAVAVPASLSGSLLIAACQPPPRNSENVVVAASATANEPRRSNNSSQADAAKR